MASIGEFGKRHDEPQEGQQEVEPVTFGWFGLEIRLATHYNQIKLMNLMESARIVDHRDPMAMVVIKDTLKLLIHPADFTTFWQIAEREEQEVVDLAPLIEACFSGMTDLPTQQLPDSSAGQLPTDESLPVDSPQPVMPGRPDLEILRKGGRETRAQIKAKAAEIAMAGAG